MPSNRQEPKALARVGEILYLFLIVLSFYLLFLSRTGEAHTVWEVLHPAFIPTLFIATSLLIIILLTSEKLSYRLLFIIVHSVLIHSLFSIVFPGGDLSGQQTMLGRTRLVYENVVLYGGFPSPGATIQSLVYDWFRGENSQAALTVVFARMLNIDPLWIHLFLVPILWGTFTPIAVYLTTHTLTKNDKVSVFASALISAFPYMIYFGAISVPQSLGFIFFFYSLCFMIKYLSSNDSKSAILMLVFFFFSFLFHDLAGIMSFSLFFLALAFKSYRSQETQSATAKFSLAISFIVSASLLPLSLIYLKLFRPTFQTVFTLDNFYEMPFQEILGRFLFGELIYAFDYEQILLLVIGPTIALLSMIYFSRYSRKSPYAKSQTLFHFLFASFLVILADYRILNLFMKGLPFGEERLWVFSDFIAAPYVALAIHGTPSSFHSLLRALPFQTVSIARLRKLSRDNIQLITSLSLALNLIIPVLSGGWIALSLSVAYPHVAPLQTTSYELEAVKYIDENTHGKYVVIGDAWTTYAGERIVGIKNPRAYYFLEYNRTGHELFVNMTRDPSPQWMLFALNLTDTNVAYFIISEPRLGTEEFEATVSRAIQNNLPVYATFGNRKLYVFYCEK
jgi:hypothetical protein